MKSNREKIYKILQGPFFLKKIKFTQKKYFILHISSSYTKILGEKLFRTWEIPRSGSKAEDGGEREKERETERW